MQAIATRKIRFSRRGHTYLSELALKKVCTNPPFIRRMKRKVFRGFFGRLWCGREGRSPLRFTRFPPDSDTRKRIKQGCMYHRLYHRSWFAGRKTYARHVPRRVAPAGLRDKTVGPSQRGVSRRSESHWATPATCQVATWVRRAGESDGAF